MDADSEAKLPDKEQYTQKKLSPLQLLTICIAQLNEATQVTLPYTVAVFMVRDFQRGRDTDAQSEETIGRLTGFLAASFCAAQFVSSFPWGRISDKVGRKPMVCMSNLASTVAVMAFGLSTRYSTAIIWRLIGGFFNCTFVCVKAMIGESSDAAGQARPLSFLSLCWGLGTVMGPTIGGVLSSPCETFGEGFPLCKEHQLFSTRPFFLPCLVVGAFSFICFLSSCFIMSETLPRIAAKRYAVLASAEADLDSQSAKQRISQLHETELAHVLNSDPLRPRASPNDVEQGPAEAVVQAIEQNGSSPHAQANGGFKASEGKEGDWQEGKPLAGSRDWDARVGEGQEKLHESPRSVLHRNDTASQMAGSLPLRVKAKAAISDTSDIEEEGMRLLSTPRGLPPCSKGGMPLASMTPREGLPLSPEQAIAAQLAKAAVEEAFDVVWWKDKQVQLTIFGYVGLAFLYNVLDEVTPIFASAGRRDGGLGLSTSELALPLALSGFTIFGWSMFFYPWFQRKVGVVNTCRSGLLTTIPLSVAISLPSFLPVGALATQLILAAVLSIKNISATNAFTAAVIMVNAAAPQKDMGSVNGASQAGASFVRAVGPALGGIVWGLSVAIPFTGHQVLAFALTGVAFLGPLLVFRFVNLPSLSEMDSAGAVASH